jgi:hypothetical protein
MNIPVLLEPTATGFRASTGAPLNLTAEAPTEEQVLTMIRAQYAVKQLDGSRVVSLDLPLPDPLVEAARRVADRPILDQVEAAMKEYRRQRELEDDAAETLAEQAKNKAASAQEPAT